MIWRAEREEPPTYKTQRKADASPVSASSAGVLSGDGVGCGSRRGFVSSIVFTVDRWKVPEFLAIS